MSLGAAADQDATAPAGYFARALRSFETAERGSGRHAARYRLGPHALHVRFAGPPLFELLTRALAHLPAAGLTAPALTICCWDTASTGIAVPPPAWPAEAYGPRGEIIGFNDARYHTVYQHGVGGLAMLDRERRLGLYWVEAADEVPYWERSFPFRILLHWALAGEAAQPVHAAAVGRPEGGVLLAGPSGSGKTTSSVACLRSDLVYAGDDYVLAAAEPEPWVWSLYGSAKLLPESVERLPWVAAHLSNRDRLDSEKGLVFLNEVMPEKLAPGFPLRGIMVPRVTGRPDTEVRRIAGGAALAALAPTTLVHLQGCAPEALGKLAALCRRVPCYALLLGTDLAQIPRRIAEVLDAGPG